MKNILLTAAAAVALSGGLFADTITGTGTLTAFVNPSGTATWINAATDPSGTGGNGTPFWNNPSGDTFGTVSGVAHDANIGYLLSDTGAFATTSINVLPGDSMTGGDDYQNSNGTDPTSFAFTQNVASENIALLFTSGGDDQYTTIGYYTGGAYNAGVNTHVLYTDPTDGQTVPSAGVSFTPGSGVTYGFYAIVCYPNGGTCETYTTSSGNTGAYTNDGWDHFAAFQTTNGNWVIGFTAQNGLYGEAEGDFQDVVFEITNTSTPEPGTIGIMGLGLAALGVLGRRRFAKK